MPARLTDVLVQLHLEASRDEHRLVARLFRQIPEMLLKRRLNWANLSPKLTDLYLAVEPANGLVRDRSNGFKSLQLPMRYAGEFSAKTEYAASGGAEA